MESLQLKTWPVSWTSNIFYMQTILAMTLS